MSFVKSGILVIGGYGNVGQHICKLLDVDYRLLVAGRSKTKAEEFVQKNLLNAQAVEFDLASNYFDPELFASISIVVNCVETSNSIALIDYCGKNSIHYTELATSYEAYLRLHKFDSLFKSTKSCLITGIGLSPGLSGIFTELAKKEMHGISKVESYTTLGLGEKHGLDAIRWMLSVADREYQITQENLIKKVSPFSLKRRVKNVRMEKNEIYFNFNFAGQHILKQQYDLETSVDWLKFDSRFANLFFRALKKIGLLKMISKANPKKVKRFLDRFSMGSEKYEIRTVCSFKNRNIQYLVQGENEAKGTATVASYFVRKLNEKCEKFGSVPPSILSGFDDFSCYLKTGNINIVVIKEN